MSRQPYALLGRGSVPGDANRPEQSSSLPHWGAGLERWLTLPG
jgi:hypothetical protein